MALRLGLINPIVCPIGDVTIPLNCVNSASNSYTALQGKYKTTSILKNVCGGRGRGWGQREQMAQTVYAHMNK
jgi:hypothetical protein